MEKSAEQMNNTARHGLCAVISGLLFFAILGILLLAAAIFFTTAKGQEILLGFF